MRLLFFELNKSNIPGIKIEEWKSRLKALYPTIDFVESCDSQWAKRAVWMGEPFVLAGTKASVDRYLDGMDDHTALLMADCGYFWLLTNTTDYQHRRLATDRVIALTWDAFEQNVVRERLQLLELFPRLKGLSNEMHLIREEISRIANEPTGPGYSVLIFGGSGVGKEEVAQSLFEISDRAKIPTNEHGGIHPLSGAWLNMEPGMALTELIGLAKDRAQRGVAYPGLMQLFTNGALFVDDFESAPRMVQESLLRVMSTAAGKTAVYRKVGGIKNEETGVWLIFSTNSPLDKLLHDDRLREDFMYRFEDRVLMVPPLKDRACDFPAIARSIWKQLWERSRDRSRERRDGEPPPLTSDTLKQLFAKDFEWEGNVRTLRAFLALIVSMKRNPAHNQSSPGMLIDMLAQRGPTYKHWVRIVATSFFATGRTFEEQIRSADTGHDRCFGPSSAEDPEESNFTPSEREARNALKPEGWQAFKRLAASAPKTKSGSVVRASVRLSRVIWYLSQSDSITWPIAAKLSDVSPNIAIQDLKILANQRGPSLIRCVDEGKHRQSPQSYSKVQGFFN
ncbi:MAG TPA: sigma 54-interacting transcriptional regulator [Candidatus Angelobacter sp.]|nr:sigma 54-interacting transcriptional regulator [Candidatus Angelobacter sp.]